MTADCPPFPRGAPRMRLTTLAIFGLVAGAIARMLHPGSDQMHWAWTGLLGVGGAGTGGWTGEHPGFDTTPGVAGGAAASGGWILLLVVYPRAPARRAALAGPATNDDYKRAVFDDLSKGPNG